MPNYTSLAATNTVIRNTTANRCFGKAGLAIHGGNSENVQTVAAVDYCIAGVMYQYAITAEIDLSACDFITETAAADTVSAQAKNTDRAYLLVLNSAGTVKVIQGTAVATAGTCTVPGCPDGYAPLGVIKVANGNSATFTLGTTGLDAAGVTDTYYDVSLAPASV